MSTVAADVPDAPRYRWLIWVVLVFAIQLGCVFWLSDRHPPAPRVATAAPGLSLAGNAHSELLALSDPTLFALPHRRGFSGEAWLRREPVPLPDFEWRDEPRFLPLPAASLGAAFREFMATNAFAGTSIPSQPPPQLTVPPPVRFQVLPEHSTLRIEGQLTGRKLLTPVELPPQPWSELLTSTIVQVAVNEEGRPVSAALVSSSGLRSADQYALDLARRLRFEFSARDAERPTPHERLQWGRLVFEWLTVPVTAASPAPASTNLPGAIVTPRNT